MADEDQTAEGDEGTKKKIPLWVFLLIGGQVVLVGGLIVAFMFLMGGSEPEPEEPTEAEQRVNPDSVENIDDLVGPVFALDPFIVNLINDGRSPRYLKMEVVFELESEEVRSEVEARVHQIRDELTMLASNKRVNDVRTADGKRILKDEIFTRVNQILVTGRIKGVLLPDFVIQ